MPTYFAGYSDVTKDSCIVAYKLSRSPNQRSSRRVFVGDIGCRIGDIAASEHLQGISEKKYQKCEAFL